MALSAGVPSLHKHDKRWWEIEPQNLGYWGCRWLFADDLAWHAVTHTAFELVCKRFVQVVGFVVKL